MFNIIPFLLLCNSVFGQKFSYPTFIRSCNNIKEFVPKGWTILETTNGDLNGDRINDLVAILEYKHKISESRPNDISVVTNPRVLLIFFKNSKGNLDLKLQHNTFILRNGEDSKEVYPELAIKKGVLSVHYDLFHDYPTYKFRYQNNDFYLIGATVGGVHGGLWSEDDINFSTKDFYTTSYYVEDEQNKKVKHLHLKDLKPLKLKDFKMPLTYKISKDYTL
ncbi:MAG: hypothetical protein EOP45_12240 [Sphingobacteriaceae bacterium]|nr:MAG: hypothetical protein EOP45_12240 [Sphingobacteriaceae bacterium]